MDISDYLRCCDENQNPDEWKVPTQDDLRGGRASRLNWKVDVSAMPDELCNRYIRSGFWGGKWLEAYVFNAVNSALRKISTGYELASSLRYETANMIISASDIDVYASLNNHIFFIECKSGRYALETLVQRARKISTIISNSNSDLKVHHIIVVMPDLVSDPNLENFLKEQRSVDRLVKNQIDEFSLEIDLDVRVIEPAMLRTYFADLFDGMNSDD